MENVTGIFDGKSVANQAVTNLIEAGISNSKISLVMTRTTREKLFGVTEDTRSEKTIDDAAKGAGAGAAVGGVLGALIAGLAAAGTIVSTSGALLVTGPVVAALTGGGAGAVAGGVAGALINAGFSEDEADRYEAEIERGKALVIVHCGAANEASRVRSILNNSGALLKAA